VAFPILALQEGTTARTGVISQAPARRSRGLASAGRRRARCWTFAWKRA